MTELQSHNTPHLTLAEHLDQIRQAATAIWGRHSPGLLRCCAEACRWFDDAVCLHDAGKASQAFQQYIADPTAYGRRHSSDTKAHTPLSTVCALQHGKKANWDWQHVLAVALIAAGHHSEFKTHEELERGVCNDRMIEVIGEQVRDLDWDALQRAIGIPIAGLAGKTGMDITCEASDRLGELVEQLHDLTPVDGVRFRLLCQLAFSVLLEADKAFLAVKEKDRAEYLKQRSAGLLPQFVDQRLAQKPVTNITPLQQQARREIFARISGNEEIRIHTLTLPTGTGKTLLAASWALTLRDKIQQSGSPSPLVLVVLPYLAIIDQTATEYEAVFKSHVEPGELISYHSLSDRSYAPDLEDQSQDFFLDTWQSNVVITTFDQFLFALLSPKARHQMRFHNLADALIVMDEVQALPLVLLEQISEVL
jgi:CRISPR-associated endonuclease/helicase Cas3